MAPRAINIYVAYCNNSGHQTNDEVSPRAPSLRTRRVRPAPLCVDEEYLSALISQSFLDIGSVSRILDNIMKLCLQFCWNIENQESSQNTAELEHITEEFNKKSNSLYTILRSSRLAGSQRAPFLRRFLLCLNFNSFFEATARGVLNVVRPRPALQGLNQP